MTISPYEDAHFLREGIVDINAAVVGISKARWTYLEESDAIKAQAEAIMRALLRYVGDQPSGWALSQLFPFVEHEIASGVVWGKKK